MLVRIVIIAALIAVTLGVIQKKDVLQRAGLTGYCTTSPRLRARAASGTNAGPAR